MSSASSDVPVPSHWRRSLVRSKTKDGQTKVELFLDNTIHPIKVPKEASSSSSTETIEIQRELPPSGCACQLPYPLPPPPPPFPQVYLAPAEVHKQRPNSSSLYSSSSSSATPPNVIGTRTVLFTKSPPASQKPDASRQRLGLDGHSHSADFTKRRSRKRTRDIADEIAPSHYCAKCGRSRSKRFQLENPIKRGIIPVPGICSRCEPPLIARTERDKDATPRMNEREVEELLIRRSRPHPDPVIRVFQPRQYKLIRVIRARSPSLRPRKIRQIVEQKSSSCSEDSSAPRGLPSVRTGRIQRDVYTETTPLPGPVVKVRVRSRSRSNLDEEPVMVKLDRCDNRDTDRKIASHPNAWSHVRVISKDPPPQRRNLDQVREVQSPRPRSPSPEWFYRRHRTYMEPSRPPQVECWDRRGRIDEDTFKRGVAEARQIAPRDPLFSPQRQMPMSGILNRNKHRYEPRIIDDRDADRFNRSSLPRDEVLDSRHVKFANPRDDAPNTRRAASRMKEAVDDWIEEKVDQRDFEKVKKRVRDDVHEGAGAFELDGHRSEDFGIRYSNEDFQAHDTTATKSTASRDCASSSVMSVRSATNVSSGTARTLSETSSHGSSIGSEPGEYVEVVDFVEQEESMSQSREESEVSSNSRVTELSERESLQHSKDFGAFATSYRRPEHLLSRHSSRSEVYSRGTDGVVFVQDDEIMALTRDFASPWLSNGQEEREEEELAPDVSAFDSCGARTTGTWEAESKVFAVDWNADDAILGEDGTDSSTIGSRSDVGQTWSAGGSQEQHEPVGDW